MMKFIFAYLHGSSIGGGHLDEPDAPVDGHIELAEHPQDVVPPVEDGHLLGQLRQRLRTRQVLIRVKPVQVRFVLKSYKTATQPTKQKTNRPETNQHILELKLSKRRS